MIRVVNLKLAFRDLFFQKCDNTNQYMQNPIPKFTQSSNISDKPGYLFDKLKLP